MITFEKAGKFDYSLEPVFLMSSQRKYKKETIFHRNDFHTIIKIPKDVFKKYFKYEAFSGIYRTTLKQYQLYNLTDIKIYNLTI
jgi:hypothetical protein